MTGSILPNIDFKLKEFPSKKALDSHISHSKHGSEKPGICFAFTVHERSENDYELELFFNDHPIKAYQSLPSQQNPAV
jgi:hypothetical protein